MTCDLKKLKRATLNASEIALCASFATVRGTLIRIPALSQAHAMHSSGRSAQYAQVRLFKRRDHLTFCKTCCVMNDSFNGTAAASSSLFVSVRVCTIGFMRHATAECAV